MPNYNRAHSFYAGVDLHARSLYLHVLSRFASPARRHGAVSETLLLAATARAPQGAAGPIS